MDNIYTFDDFIRYVTLSAVMLGVLAPLAIAGWSAVLFGILWLLKIKVRETFSGLSWQKAAIVCAFIIGSANIMGSVFKRFV